jgi:hypothetical protein
MKIASVLVGIVTLLLVSGCAPEEGKVCAQLANVYQGHMDPPKFLKERATCVEHFAARKKRHGVNSYRREAECILAATKVYDARECSEKEDFHNR